MESARRVHDVAHGGKVITIRDVDVGDTCASVLQQNVGHLVTGRDRDCVVVDSMDKCKWRQPAIETYRLCKKSQFASNVISTVNIVRCCYNAVNFLLNPHKIHSIARPLEARYGVYFDTKWYSASLNAVLYEISSYIGTHHNGTRLYLIHWQNDHNISMA